MDPAALPGLITWAAHYRPAWDMAPDAYFAAGLVGRNKTRRLGKLEWPGRGFKAYIGVQHVDPAGGRWLTAQPEARFWVSWFVGGRSVGLRVASTIPAALQILAPIAAPFAAGES